MPHLSDHCHLSFAIKANCINRDSLETSAELTLTGTETTSAQQKEGVQTNLQTEERRIY